MLSATPPTPLQTPSPAFPGAFRRSKTPPLTIKGRVELPIDKESYGGGISTPPLEMPPYQDSRKDRVHYKPIPEKRMLGYFSTAALIINRMIGTGIFSKPSDILNSTGSKGGSIILWVTGGFMTLSGLVYPNILQRAVLTRYYSLLIYLEFGIALPFNGGELVYVGSFFQKRPQLIANGLE